MRDDGLKNLVELKSLGKCSGVAHEIYSRYSSFGAKRTPRTAQTDKTA